VRDFNKYWSKDFDRLVTPPQKPEDWGPVWSAISGKFKFRPGNREGCLCTNHQGFVALYAISRIMGEKEPLLAHELDSSDGITIPNQLALVVAHALRAEAECWFGGARTGLNRLSVLVIEALADARVKNRNAIAVVDTTSPSIYGYSPSLRHEKDKRYHEAAHVWQFTVNPKDQGLISEEKILSEPEFPVLTREVAKFHKNPTPSLVYTEATAWSIAGEGWNVGLQTKARTEAFLERFFREVKFEYGREALEMLHLAHPHIRRILDYVRSESIERDVGRGEERTSGKAVERGGTGAASPGETGEQAAGASRRDEVSPGSLGEGRDHGRDEVKTHLRKVFLGMGDFDSGIRLGGMITFEIAPRGDLALAQQRALEKIAAIDPSNPNEIGSWSKLGRSAVAIAREAVNGVARAEDGAGASALWEIAEMEPVYVGDTRRSWKDVTVAAVEKARVALEAISPSANIRTDLAIGATETAQDAHSNGRPPAQRICW
jgi:hypothetical protein